MKNYLIIVILAVAGGVFLYANRDTVDTQISTIIQPTSTVSTTIATSTNEIKTNAEVQATTSLQRCESEVRRDIIALKPVLIGVSFVEAQAFNSAISAKAFLTARGYVNPTGRVLADINASNSSDLSVAIILLESTLPDKVDDDKLVIMDLTQPVVCINGALGSNSKDFLNVTLKNEAGVRAALYQSGQVREDL